MTNATNNCDALSEDVSSHALIRIEEPTNTDQNNCCKGNQGEDGRIRLRSRKKLNKIKDSQKKMSKQYKVNKSIQGNKLLCRLIKKHPCLYDANSSDYLKDRLADKAWSDISKTLKDTRKYYLKIMN